MKTPHKRPPPRPPLQELINLRKQKYPGMAKRKFAEQILGVTRLHFFAIEDGRRQPSLELAVRWVRALAPEANLAMFGPLPVVTQQIRHVKALAEIAPDYYQAA